MPTVANAEARRLLPGADRLADVVVADPGAGDAGSERGRAEFLRRAARYDAACRDLRREGPLSETGAGPAQHVRRTVYGAAVDRAIMVSGDARAEAAGRGGLWPVHRRRLRYPV